MIPEPDVLVSDVWLCSGQSNMAFRMSKVANASQEIAAAKNSSVRYFKVAERFAQQPVTEVNGAWKPISPETAAECSAVVVTAGGIDQPAAVRYGSANVPEVNLL